MTIMSYELPLILVLLAVGRAAGLRLHDLLAGADNGHPEPERPLPAGLAAHPGGRGNAAGHPLRGGAPLRCEGEARRPRSAGPLVEWRRSAGCVQLSHCIKMFIMTALFTASSSAE